MGICDVLVFRASKLTVARLQRPELLCADYKHSSDKILFPDQTCLGSQSISLALQTYHKPWGMAKGMRSNK